MLRRSMLVTALALACSYTVTTSQAESPTKELKSHALFNGSDLSGWNGDPAFWNIKEGVIHGETSAENPAKGNTFLIWEGDVPSDFELKLEFRCTTDNNSGIQYRSRHITDATAGNKWVVRGYQHELRNELTFPNVSGFIYDEGGKRGRICLLGEKASWEKEGKKVHSNLIDQDSYNKLFKLNDWNEVKIKAVGNHIQHYMNGTLVLDFVDNVPELALLDGVIALQLHAGKPMWAEFRSIELRELEVSDSNAPSK